jgi:hypothetical protein
VRAQELELLAVSTPSATTRMRRLCAIAMTARVMAASSVSCGRSLMNERSILTLSIGKRFR